MTERYPLDATLLAAVDDPTTGVEYIATGTSPYVLAFRRLVHRMLRAFERANDLRVYQDGETTFGVRPGSCRINDQAIDFPGVTQQSATPDATTYVWIDDAGTIQTSTDSFPATVTTYLALAIITTDGDVITNVNDRRGESFLQSPTASTLGLTATADEINQALDGIAATVSAPALSLLTAGADVTVDLLHRHVQSAQDVAGTAGFRLINNTTDPAGNYALVFSLPNLPGDDTVLELNPDNRWLSQRQGSVSYNLLGVSHVQHHLSGDITASLADEVLGVAPVAGTVSAVVLSLNSNIISDDQADGISIDLKVNGSSITTTQTALTAAEGSGFRCSDQGDGTAGVIASDGSADVARGDLLHFDLTYTGNGNVTSQPADAVIAVVIRAAQPE